MTNTTLLVIVTANQAIVNATRYTPRGGGFLTDSQGFLLMGAFLLIAALVTALIIFIDNARYAFHYSSALDYVISILMGSVGIFFLVLAAVFR